MKIIQSEIFSRYPKVKFAFSTKIGLNREAPYYFNMSKTVGDDPKLVDENRELFFSSIGLKPNQIAFQKQIHTDKISIVTKPGYQGESDAMLTDKPNIGLAISTADCTPIFIYDTKQKIIAAIHSGWRSTKAKIVSKTLDELNRKFNCKPENLIAYIGPCISQKNYEVSSDFIDYFDEKYLQPIGDKFLLDLKLANKDMLFQFGISEAQIEVSPFCSFGEDYLHSYRRDGKVSGRALGIISFGEG
ncbi:MAG: peptidoglycan editing factor PgeF [Melioribacteraceae bacterium]|nr:MAG: peptidoglycan editing factor PgeF [Melioribacteraceae bacterium]